MDLLKILGDDFDMTGFCDQSYWKWEDRALVRLKELGYTIIKPFWTSERDSFGPLMRSITIRKDGVITKCYYG